MKNKRLNILFVSSIVIVLIIVSLILIINDNRGSKNISTGVGDMPYDDFYNWETNLHIKAIELFNNIYSEDYEFQLDSKNEYYITIADLENEGMDVGIFNTDEVSCDLEKSFIKIYYEDNNQLRSVHMECIKK